MNRILSNSVILLIAGLFMLAPTSCESSNKSIDPVGKTKTHNVDVSTFNDILVKNSYTLIDVRTPNEFKGGTIKTAKNINVSSSTFQAEIQKLDKTKPVMVFCRSGVRSSKAMKKMAKLGFTEIYNLKGGYLGWKRAGL